MNEYATSRKSNRKTWSWFFMILLTLLICNYAGQLVFSWLSIVLISFIIGFLLESLNRFPFISGFLSNFLIWFVVALSQDLANVHLLSDKVIRLFPVAPGEYLLVIITGLLGGIIGGMAVLTGHTFRTLVRKKDIASRYY